MAIQLNIPKALVEIPLALAFILSLAFGISLLESWHVRLKWLAAILAGSVSSGILLMCADGYVRESVNNASPFFQSVFGYSLPVLIVYLLAFFGIFIWQCHEKKELTQPEMQINE